MSKVKMLCSLLEILLLDNDKVDMMAPESTTYLLQSFAWASLWSLGSNLTQPSKNKLEIYIRKMFQQMNDSK